jgi:DNA-binding NtrC family response regulator
MFVLAEFQACINEGGDRIRVLHVDDEPGLRDIVASFLEREDDRITVQTAPAPQDGREILDDHEVNCIVSDYDMPHTNGIEFLRTVRKAYPDLPFILYTGKGTEDVAAEAVSAGATDYLQKESSTEQYTVLANRVVNAVERYRSQQEAEHTRKQLQAILENSTDAIVIIDSDSRIRFANPAFEVLFGRLPEDLQGESVTTIMPD